MAAYDVIVIGGGAAGMFSAATAAFAGSRVLLLEKTERFGWKLSITGKGRCNVTNHCTAGTVLENVPRNPRFLYSVMDAFPPQQAESAFEAMGVPLKTERGNRVFPVSDRAGDVVAALKAYMRKAGVHCRNEGAEALLIRDGAVAGVKTARGEYTADRVILATGGLSYPQTGSTGDGYRMAEAAGHTIVPSEGSLVPLEISGGECRKMAGLSLRNVQAMVYDGKKELYSDFGEMLFTHFGVSGPLIISASAYVGKILQKKHELKLVIDLKPALSEEQLDARVLREFDTNHNKQFKNAVTGLFPAKLLPVMIHLSGIDPEKKVNVITKEERMNFVHLIKHFTVTLTGLRDFKEAIITRGGVKVKEVNPSTMESKLVQGLYFAGEVLDLDALTGGFNLQIAWSTAYAAGSNIW